MFEKVNPSHPDKLADRIAGAIVDLAYKLEKEPKIAVEVLIGHGRCYIIAETSVTIDEFDVEKIVKRITGKELKVEYIQKAQDLHLAENQKGKIRCGDNGIFRGSPETEEQKWLVKLAKALYERYPTDGKYLIDCGRITICQSNAKSEDLYSYGNIVNPLGDWSGGIDVDTGATNRKLGSDLGDSITGGGIHGKDLSKADVSVTIYAWLKAQRTGKVVEYSCSIGDETVDDIPFETIVKTAWAYVCAIGGFEKLAEWGLLR